MGHRIGCIGLMLAGALSPIAAKPQEPAAAATDTTQRGEKLRQRLEEIQAKLNLNEDQKEKVAPILRSNLEKRREILEKAGMLDENGEFTGKRPPMRQLRRLSNQIQDLQESTRKQLSSILTADQMKELSKIQQEQRQQLRDRYREL